MCPFDLFNPIVAGHHASSWAVAPKTPVGAQNQWIGLRENWNRNPLHVMGQSKVSGEDFPD